MFRKALIVVALGVSLLQLNPSVYGQQGLFREVYTNIFGGIDGLTNDFNFPDAPGSTGFISDFEAPANVGNNYGQRVRGFIVPPVTGNYVFWISSDDGSRLFLSSNEDPANRQLIAFVNGFTGQRVWDTEPNQRSIPIRLEAGKRYYIEALMAEGGGGDHLAVRWQLPDGTIEEPIPASRLLVELIAPQISRQPQHLTVTEGESATFGVTLVNVGPVSYQWQRNGVNLPSETNATLFLPAARITDSGARFRVTVRNNFGEVTSSDAFLSVRRDIVPPTIISAQNSGENDLVTITFSEPLNAASAVVPGNYQFTGGVQVLGASLDENGRTVILRTSPLTLGTTYSISVSNVGDRAAQSNPIEPDSRVDFVYQFTALPVEIVYGKRERIGPSTRRTGLVISEIMYHPADRADGRNLEFIEIYNSNPFIANIGGYRLTGAIDYTFPPGTFISATNFLVVAANPSDVQTVYGVQQRIYGGFEPGLPNDSGLLQLRNEHGAVLLEVEYGSEGLWAAEADGGGNSLYLARPSYGEADPRAWEASTFSGGTPGADETIPADPYAGVVINEFLANSDAGFLDYVELFNYSAKAIDLSGVWLSDDADTNRFRIPDGTVLQPMGRLAYNETSLGFALSSAGEAIFVRTPQGTRTIDAIRFGAQAVGVAQGRFPDGNPRIQPLVRLTPGGANAPAMLPDVVFNEIMYNPVSGDQEEEFLELYNRSGRTINISGWRLNDGVSYTFPENTILGNGAYFVVAKNILLLRTNNPTLTAQNSIGNFNGNLSNGGERLVLERPELNVVTDGSGESTTNITYVVVDEVDFSTGGRWGQWSDGGGSSLELISANSDNDLAPNWVDSDETGKSAWTTIERRGILDWGSTNFNATAPSRALHVLMMGAGEALLDNVEVIPDGGTNIVSNPGFLQGSTDWLMGGTHESSTVRIGEGASDPNSLHIRAADRGDTAANRIRVKLDQGLTNGMVATVRANVRWLRGDSEILLRLHGNYLEAAGRMELPKNLGTPGTANSGVVANPGPSITQVTHSPVLPAAGQSITVVGEVKDSDRLALVMLNYRVDPGTNFVSVPMAYNGAGFYSGTIPGQANGAMVAFYIEALDSRGMTSRFPNDAPVREALVHVGEQQNNSTLGTYRLWVSDKNVKRWEQREQSSNKAIDATFVYNGERVVYNMGTLYSGSPFHWGGYDSPLGNGANYEMEFPDDDLFLGQNDFVLNLPSNIGSDTTAIREQIFFWMAEQLGQPANYRRFHYLFINGMDRNAGLAFEDAQQPNRDFIEQWYPEDSEGELYKIEDWFEFSEAFSRFNYDARLLGVYTTNLATGERELKQELYRWWFRKRAVQDSAHDYSELHRLVEAANNPEDEEFVSEIEALVDIDEWMGAIALRHAVGDWDAFGYSRGKNMYAYKPENGKWQLLHWDIAFAFGLGDGTSEDLFDVTYFDGTEDLITKRMMVTPQFRRSYLRTLYEAASGPFTASRVNAIMDARYNGIVREGVGAVSPESVKNWIANRRSFILSQLANVTSGFSITSNNGSNFTTNRNTVLLRGTAPVQVKTLRINGVEYPVTWTDVTTWEIRLALDPSLNLLTIEGYDSNGNLVSQASDTIAITYNGNPDQAAGRLVFSEIAYNPILPDAEFVELHNTSRTTSFDLSGYRINGIGYTFQTGTTIAPGGFLVLAKNAVAFGDLYGFTVPIWDEFTGSLDNGGETLTLFGPDDETIFAMVRYDDSLPWNIGADGTAASLQLIDAAQDSSRVGNWTAQNNRATPNETNSVRATFTAFPGLWVNEVMADNLSGPTDAAGDRDPWVELYNAGSAPISLAGYYLTDDYANLQKWAFPAGASLAAGERRLVWLDGEANENTASQWHASFRLASSTGTIGLVGLQNGAPVVFDYLRYEQLPAGRTYGAFPEGQAIRREIFFVTTPGAANDASAGPIQVFINEWMAANTRTIADPDDNDFDDWFELYNAGTTPADLSGYNLTDALASPNKFTIPNGTVIPAGGFLLVWADEENSDNGQLHVNFKLSAGGESIGLFAPDGTTIDTVTFGEQTDDVSQGRFPNGSNQIRAFTSPTPGSSNVGGTIPGLQFTAIQTSATTITLSFSSDVGTSYQLQYKNSLADETWTTLNTVQATEDTTSVSDPISQPHRFYRIVEQ